MVIDPTKFDKILKITHDLWQIQDFDMLLEQLLTEVRSIVGADAGSIYMVEGAKLKFSYTQNTTLQRKLPFGKKLIYATFTVDINNKSMAGYVAGTGLIVNISDAYDIDSFQPYAFDKQFDEASGYRTQSVLAVPIKIAGNRPIGVIQLINAFNPDKTIRSFTAAEEAIVQLFADNAAIAINHAQMMRTMIMRMNKMIELHDPSETVEHANRVAAYAVEIYEAWAQKKGVPARELQHNRDILRMAAMFHDIGKISVPTAILQKKEDELSGEEAKIKEQHTIYGANLFPDGHSDFETMARVIALTHHEHWDGSGYPGHVNLEDGLPLPGYEAAAGRAFGKSGQEIPIYGRIVALANTYDNLIFKVNAKSDSIRQESATIEQAVATILASSGTRFDPEVVVAFMSSLDMINAIRSRYQAG